MPLVPQGAKLLRMSIMNTVGNALIDQAKRYLGASLVLFISMMAPGYAAEEPTLKAQYDAAFLEMYEDVGNLDKTFRFAELAIAVGDLEGAAAALERMLIIEPDLPQVRMQLGTLYFQLASYAMALTYLNAVVSHDEVPDEVKQDAQELITRIDQLTSPHRFNGTVVAGVRYQSNANGGPMTQDIRLFGGSAVLDEQYTHQSDWDVSLAGQFTYVFDFETEPSATLETGLSAYSSWQDTQSQVDTTLFELQFGPRFVFTPNPGTALDLRPYALVNDMTLGGKDSFEGVGAGLDLAFRTSMTSAWTAGTRYVERDYDQVEEVGLKVFIRANFDGLFVGNASRLTKRRVMGKSVFAPIEMAGLDHHHLFNFGREHRTGPFPLDHGVKRHQHFGHQR